MNLQRLAATALALAATLSACGSDDSSSTDSAPVTTASSGSGATVVLGNADIEFA